MEITLPFTYMCVRGLKMGLTTQELKTMPYNLLANMVFAETQARMPQEKSKEKVRAATQADIDAFAR